VELLETLRAHRAVTDVKSHLSTVLRVGVRPLARYVLAELGIV
jgi:hypothetical protein